MNAKLISRNLRRNRRMAYTYGFRRRQWSGLHMTAAQAADGFMVINQRRTAVTASRTFALED